MSSSTVVRRRYSYSRALSRRAAVRRLNSLSARAMWTVRRPRTAMWPRAVARCVFRRDPGSGRRRAVEEPQGDQFVPELLDHAQREGTAQALGSRCSDRSGQAAPAPHHVSRQPGRMFRPVAGGVYEVCPVAACGAGRVVVDQVVRRDRLPGDPQEPVFPALGGPGEAGRGAAGFPRTGCTARPAWIAGARCRSPAGVSPSGGVAPSTRPGRGHQVMPRL